MIDLEPQGLRREVLEVLTPTSIQIGDEVYAVHDTGIDEEPAPGIHVDVIAFDDLELAKEMDAAYIQGEPGCSTPIQHWTGSRVFVEKIMRGCATWIGVNPEGEVFVCEFDAEKNDNGTLVYGQGWTGSWVAGPEGVEFVEICIPAFEDDGTIEVFEPGDEAVPLLFQAIYHTLMNLKFEDQGSKELMVALEGRLDKSLTEWKADPKNEERTKELTLLSELAYDLGFVQAFDIQVTKEEWEDAISAPFRGDTSGAVYTHVFNRPLVAMPHSRVSKDDASYTFAYSTGGIGGPHISIGKGRADMLMVVGVEEVERIGLKVRV